MQIRFATTLPCTPEVAWRAMHTRSIGARLPLPLAAMHFADPGVDRWNDGDNGIVEIRLGGFLPVGTQRIVIEDLPPTGTTRSMRDAGMPLTGVLARLNTWDHVMSVAPGRNDHTTLWRDQVSFTGLIAPLAACMLWPLWQWRRVRLTATAHRWRIRSSGV